MNLVLLQVSKFNFYIEPVSLTLALSLFQLSKLLNIISIRTLSKLLIHIEYLSLFLVVKHVCMIFIDVIQLSCQWLSFKVFIDLIYISSLFVLVRN